MTKRAIVGSINLAPGSFDSRRELAIRVDDEHIIRRILKTLEEDWANSHPLDLSDEGLIAELKKHDPNVEEDLAITAGKHWKHIERQTIARCNWKPDSKISHDEETEMSKTRPTTGSDGLALPILPPDRDARVWARLVRIMFYLPGFMGLLLIKTGEPASFGITVELLMLSSASAIVGGIFIGSQSAGGRRRCRVAGRHLERFAGARIALGGSFPGCDTGAVP